MRSTDHQSLRPLLTELEAAGELRRVAEPVDPRFELSAWLGELDHGPAVLFEQVVGHELSVVGNLLNSRDRLARGLGVGVGRLSEAIRAAVARPVPPGVVDDAPCQEVVVDDPDLAELPVPTFFEHETGPYVTAGAIVARDRASGAGNLSIARLRPLGRNRAFIGIAPNHHLAVMARAAANRGESFELAVCIGNHPAVLVAACLYLGLGDDEVHNAGALLGEPVDLVRCGRVDLAVPAACEIVLECTLDPSETLYEGLVSEYHGMYMDYGHGYVVTVRRLTRRGDAVYQAIQPGHHPEHVLLGAVAIGAGLTEAVRRAVPSVREVALPMGGSGRLTAVVAIEGARPGEARRAMFAVWAAVSIVKQVTVVDADVDPWDADRVEWAKTCFVRPERDLVVVPEVRTDRSEPLERGGVVTKLGIDATRRSDDRPDWRVAAPPPDVVDRVRRRISPQ